MIDSTKLQKARERAMQRIDNARLATSIAFNGRMSEPMQLATFKRIKQNPNLETQLRNRYGDAKWNDYEMAMGELESKLGGTNAQSVD